VRALQGLGVAAHEAVAIEDSPSGVVAARTADIPVIVTRSAYFADAPIQDAQAIGPGLHDRQGWSPAPPRAPAGDGEPVGLADIEHWCACPAPDPQFT
jgi:hypothetical protein